jgi:hypothetical protein
VSPSWTEAFANASNLNTANSTRQTPAHARPGGIVSGPKIAIASRAINQVSIGIYCLANDNCN